MIRRWLMALMMTLSVLVSFIPLGVAEAAAPFGRAAFQGYFDNQCDDIGGFVFQNGIHPTAGPLYNGKPFTANFISQVLGHLGGGGRDRTGAEFLILTMLGYPAGTSRATAHNAAVVNTWVNTVHTYSDNGWIQWNVPYAYVNNTYYQGVNGSGFCSSGEPDDDAWFPDSGVANPTIIFHRPGSPDFYVVKEQCANPLGDMNGLAIPDYNVNLSAGGSVGTVIQNGTYSLTASLNNTGPATSEAGTLQVQYPGAALVVQPCGPTCVPAGQGNLTARQTGKGFRAGSGIPGVAGTNWYWTTAPIPNTAAESATVNFTVSATAAVGSIITFDVYYYKADLGGTVKHVTVSFRVVSARYPIVSGANGDVHAGGGLCQAPLSTGYVQGHAPTPASNAQSFSDYVVSASQLTSAINNFNSDGPVGGGGTNNLKLGKSGGYAQICREDLYKAAHAYEAVGTGYSIRGTGSYDISSWTGLYYITGAAQLHGQVNHKVTVVADGDVTISGPITITNATFPAHEDPTAGVEGVASLGVITAGNILIPNAVTRVDAYLFANGTIDTCVEGQTSHTACTANLLVNGFLMAHDIAFHRVGPTNTNGAPVTEQVVLNPQIYLNPPKFFDASVDDLLLEGQGEKQPLF